MSDTGLSLPYEVIVRRNVSVRMRDGIVLSTDLYLPALDGQCLPGPWPAVMTRTAYDKSVSGFTDRATCFAARGYFAVVQDVRGTFASQGDFIPFVNEVDDGCDTLAWLMDHESCNGEVGTYGCSYMGWTP